MSMSPQEVFEVTPPSVEFPDAQDPHVEANDSVSRGRLIFKRFLRHKSGLLALLVLVLIL